MVKKAAIANSPATASGRAELAKARQMAKQGKLADAAGLCRQMLAGHPDDAESLTLLVAIELQERRPRSAIDACRRALSHRPDHAVAHNLLGQALRAAGEVAAAIAEVEAAVALDPGYVDAHFNLGVTRQKLGQADLAEASYRRVLALRRDHTGALVNLGNIVKGRGALADAISLYRRAIAAKPDFAEATSNLAGALAAQGKIDRAIELYRRAIALKPGLAAAHNNLGTALKRKRRLAEAAASFRTAILIEPAFAEAHFNLGSLLIDQDALAEGIESFERALAHQPDFPEALAFLVHQLHHVCRWDRIDDLNAKLLAIVRSDSAYRVPPFCLINLPSTPADQLACARQWAKQSGLDAATPAFTFDRRPKDRLRIGYLSADLRDHATSRLAAGLFESHDRGEFEIYGLSIGQTDDTPLGTRVRNAFDRFVDLSEASDLEAAERIHRAGIDILVDMKGYTWGARSRILALRPAPIQVNFLGFPGTMGTGFIDYIIADAFVLPPDQQQYFTEKPVYLPGSYQCNDRLPPIAEPAPTRAQCGLPDDALVFCCFNNSYKITAQTFDVWMRLLGAVENSVLWLYQANAVMAGNLRREAAARGIAADRLVFAQKLPTAEHRARQRLADLFLDTWPCNAHTTASDALAVGLPMVTVAGPSFAGRVAGSLLRAVGLPELVAASAQGYESLALGLARDRAGLAALRARLGALLPGAALFDSARYARRLEFAFRAMAQTYRAGQPPRAIEVPGII